MLIGRPIAILYFLARKTTAEGAEERRAFNHLFLLRVTPRTLRLNSRCGYSSPHVLGSPCIVKSPDSGFRYLSSYSLSNISGMRQTPNIDRGGYRPCHDLGVAGRIVCTNHTRILKFWDPYQFGALRIRPKNPVTLVGIQNARQYIFPTIV